MRAKTGYIMNEKENVDNKHAITNRITLLKAIDKKTPTKFDPLNYFWGGGKMVKILEWNGGEKKGGAAL